MVGGGWVMSYLRSRIARLVPSRCDGCHTSVWCPLSSLFISVLLILISLLQIQVPPGWLPFSLWNNAHSEEVFSRAAPLIPKGIMNILKRHFIFFHFLSFSFIYFHFLFFFFHFLSFSFIFFFFLSFSFIFFFFLSFTFIFFFFFHFLFFLSFSFIVFSFFFFLFFFFSLVLKIFFFCLDCLTISY